jgi:hypothetical protein
MNDFSAHMELGATVEPSLELLTYNAPMPSIALPGFQVRKPRTPLISSSKRLIRICRYLE